MTYVVRACDLILLLESRGARSDVDNATGGGPCVDCLPLSVVWVAGYEASSRTEWMRFLPYETVGREPFLSRVDELLILSPVREGCR